MSQRTSAECTFCLSQVSSPDLKVLSCGENVCRLCLNFAFEGATYDESRFPPRCSHGEIFVADVKDLLFRAVFDAYERKAPEFRTNDRTHCFDLNCARWIPPEHIVGELGTCISCRKTTCSVCKAESHRGYCPQDTATEAFLQTAKERGYQQCQQCGRVVELHWGCNHIVLVSS